MFDFKLTDIFSTICIGVLTLSLILYFYFIFNKFFVKDKFDNEAFLNWLKSLLGESYKESGYAIIGLVVIYCMGIIAGDLTERMVDSSDSDKSKFLTELKWFSQLESQDDHRKEALFSQDFKLTGLGKSVFTTPIIIGTANKLAMSNFLQDPSKDVKKQIESLKISLKKDSKMQSSFDDFIKQIYYLGKNWCYSKSGEPLNELKSIQSRIDLSKSMVLLVAIGIQLLILLVCCNLIIVMLKNKKNAKNNALSKKMDIDGFVNLLQIRVFLCLIVIMLVANETFDINESNYNKRAYGYYVNYIQQLQIDRQLKMEITQNKPNSPTH